MSLVTPASVDWSKFAAQYAMASGDTFTQALLESCMRRHFFTILDTIVADKKQVRILILAGGPGPEIAMLLSRYGGQAFTALLTDASPVMVQQAAANVAAAGVQDIVETRVMDATMIDVPPGSYDVVLMCYGIFAVPEYATCLEQIARALKPGGTLFLSTPGAVSRPLELMEEEKRRWDKERYADDDPIVVAQAARFASLHDSPWRKVDIARQRVTACAAFKDDVNAVIVPVMWATAEEKSINELLDTLYHHPILTRVFMADFADDEQERKTFFARVRQRALAVGKAEGGLAAESVAVAAQKSAAKL